MYVLLLFIYFLCFKVLLRLFLNLKTLVPIHCNCTEEKNQYINRINRKTQSHEQMTTESSLGELSH